MLMTLAPGDTIEVDFTCTVAGFFVYGAPGGNIISAGPTILGFGPVGPTVAFLAVTSESIWVMDAFDVKSWEDDSPTGCILVGKSWNDRRDVQVIFDSPAACEDFERRWVLTMMRFCATHAESEDIVTEPLILNENTGEMLTMPEAMTLIESGCSQAGDRDGMQGEQAENTEM